MTSDTLPAGSPVPDGSVILRWNLSGTFSAQTPGINPGTTQFGISFIQPSIAPLIDGVTVASSQANRFDLNDSVDLGRQFRVQFFRDLSVGDMFMIETRMYVSADEGYCPPCSLTARFSAGTSVTSENPDIQLLRLDLL